MLFYLIKMLSLSKGSRQGGNYRQPQVFLVAEKTAKSCAVIKLITAIRNPALTDQQQVLVLQTAAEHPIG